ncbi:MAG: glycoside hydrolase family 2 TIM barrel-domain containing protein [Kiritimatiellae bacterium]|nr:glycoside hydrolase family 2 TIM barrel-domain containing protein [Kiritimatiellia bacterium]
MTTVCKALFFQVILILIPSLNVFGENLTIIFGESREFVSLNGEWDVLPIKGLTFNYPAPKNGWHKEAVPQRGTPSIKSGPYADAARSFINTGKFDKKDGMAAWFKRDFVLPGVIPRNKRVFLRFNGIAFRSETWLNGAMLGVSYQCAVPVEYDVTKHIKPGKNELIVGVTGVEGVMDLEHRTLLTPALGMYAGIRDDVSLSFRPETYIDDVFVKTSVKKHMLDADITIINTGNKAVTITPSLTVLNVDGVPQFMAEGGPVTIEAGKTEIATISREWSDPILWTVDNGTLYTAQARLTHDKAVSDRVDQLFGFREFETRGRDFFLNGIKVVLLRNSMLSCLGGKPAAGSVLAGDPRVNPNDTYNSIRMHLGFNNKYVLDAADKAGRLVTPESSWGLNLFPVDKKELWLPHTLEYFQKWVKQNRNRPAVIMWSLANETYWGRVPENPAMKEIAVEIVNTVRATDPTRPLDGDAEVGWDGLLDVISIHYPGLPGELSEKYPNSGFIVPNDLYWLKDKGNHSWRAAFDWDKPLSLGEFWNIDGEPDKWSSCGGEDVYNWLKYSTKDLKGRHADNESEIIEVLKKACDAYRVQGVACLNPWSGNAEWTMPRVAVRALDFHPNYYGGKTVEKKLAIFYDSNFILDYQRLQCFITVNGNKVWEEVIPVHIKPGDQKVVLVPITPPKVIEQTEAELTVRLMFHSGGGAHEKTRHSETIFIMPKVALSKNEIDKTRLFSSDEKTINALSKIGFNLPPVKVLDESALNGKKLIIVGADIDVNAEKSIIFDFVEKGGSVIFLQREQWEYMGVGFPEQDMRHVTTRSWKRTYNHPVVERLDTAQLSYWRPDNLVGKSNFLKPYSGDIKVILDAAGTRGLEWTPLCEKEYGQGTFIFSQLSLVDRISVEPAADQILVDLITYCLNYQSREKPTLRLLAKNNTDLENILDTARVRYIKGLQGDGPILFDASLSLSTAEMAQIKSYLNNGGKLWLHGFTPETIAKTKVLFPFEPVLAEIDKAITTAVRLEDSPLMNNLSTRDFFWARVQIGNRVDYLHASAPTAPLGDYELRLPTLQAGVKLLEPALLTEIPVNKGIILFDTINLEKAYETEGDYVVRIVSALASNLGCDIASSDEQEREYFGVDLTEFVNMGYVDEIADDGKGGWMDMGKLDLCFFLINHTGLGGGVGMPVAVDPFPEKYRFCGIPFQLVAPEKNNGNGMISLRGTDRGLKLIDKVLGIPVNKKASDLWFVNSATYVPKEKDVILAKYVIHYTDKTSVDFPIRSWIEIGDWSTPVRVDKAKICWTGNNRVLSHVGLYLTPWTNPYPEKTIASIDILGALTTAQVGVIGIAGATTDLTRMLLWELSNYDKGIVKEQSDTYSFALHKINDERADPIKATVDGQTALKLNGNMYFTSNLALIDHFNSEHPFSVEVGLSIDELPEARNRHFGVYQAMNYMKSGFRTTISTKGSVGITVFTGQGKALNFGGKTELVPGRYYDIKVSFDGTQVKLLVNGELDLVRKSPLPAPFSGNVFVGHASGEGTLKGDIHHIKITQP